MGIIPNSLELCKKEVRRSLGSCFFTPDMTVAPKLGSRAQAMWNALKPPKINRGMLDSLEYTVLRTWNARQYLDISEHPWKLRRAQADLVAWNVKPLLEMSMVSFFFKADVIVTPKLGSCRHGHMQCEMRSNHRKPKGGLWWSTYPDGSFSRHKKSIMTLFGAGWLFGHASLRPPVLTCLAANLACEERSSTSAKPSAIIKTEISNVMEPSKRRQNRLMFQFHFLPVTSC